MFHWETKSRAGRGCPRSQDAGARAGAELRVLPALGSPQSRGGPEVLCPHFAPQEVAGLLPGPRDLGAAPAQALGAMLGAGSRGRCRTAQGALVRRGLQRTPFRFALRESAGVPCCQVRTWRCARSELRRYCPAYAPIPSQTPAQRPRHTPASSDSPSSPHGGPWPVSLPTARSLFSQPPGPLAGFIFLPGAVGLDLDPLGRSRPGLASL